MFDELGGGSVAGVPEWSKGAHSRCAAKCFVGSNPTSGIFQISVCEFVDRSKYLWHMLFLIHMN